MQATPSQAPTKKKWYKRKSPIIAVAMVAAIAIVGNAGNARDKSTAQASPSATTETDSSPKSDSTQPAANPFGGDAPEDRLMPDVSCMNLQDAQNEIQDHGVFFSRSVDATGEGRHQVIDSHWVVVGQSPAAGTPIGEREAELSVVKYGETTKCG